MPYFVLPSPLVTFSRLITSVGKEKYGFSAIVYS